LSLGFPHGILPSVFSTTGIYVFLFSRTSVQGLARLIIHDFLTTLLGKEYKLEFPNCAVFFSSYNSSRLSLYILPTTAY